MARASFTRDALERAEGDELALACDATTLRDTVLADNAEEVRLTQALEACRGARLGRVKAALAREAELRARRAEQGLPAPIALPTIENVALHAYPDALERLIARGDAPTKSHDERIRMLERERKESLIALEKQAREREAEKEREAEHKRAEARAYDEKQRREKEERAAWAAKVAADAKERDELVAAAEKRLAAGAA